VPGQIYDVSIPLLAAAYRFRPGHRVRLMIAAADFQNAWPTPLPHTLTVHHGPEHPSHLVLPLAGHGQYSSPAPRFLPSDFPPLPPDQIPTPEYTVTRDLIQNFVTVHIKTQSGIGVNRSQYTVSIDRAGEVVVDTEFEYPIDQPGFSGNVREHNATRSIQRATDYLTEE